MYDGQERRASPHLTEEQIEAIAERAAERALAKVYEEVGKSVLRRFIWLIGTAALGLVIYLAGKGVVLK